MGEHKRLYNLLQLIGLLARPGGYSVKRLARRFDVTPRTIYRYFEILRECGFEFEKTGHRHRFRNAVKASNVLPLLSAGEAAVLETAVLSLHPDHPQKAGLLKKLRLLEDPVHLAELIVDAKTSAVVAVLLEAIREKKGVVLRNYHSPHSDTIRDRRVDPIGFSVNMKYLYAYEPEHRQVIQFKPERIGRVEVTDDTFEPDERYRIEKPDLFGMNGIPRTRVTLRLNRRARHLLLEEFPESRDVESLSGFQNLAGLAEVRLPVKGFDGVGRFVLGLPGEAEPVGPPEFLRYLEERMERSSLFRSSGTAENA